MQMFLSLLPMVYIFRSLFVLARVCCNVEDFNSRNLFLTAELKKLNEVIDIIKFDGHFLNSKARIPAVKHFLAGKLCQVKN